MLKIEVDQYLELHKKMEARAEELCRLYMKVYFDAESNDIVVTNLEAGKSGRIKIMFTESETNSEEILNLPLEYFWLTDDEVALLMSLDKSKKEQSRIQKHQQREAS